MSARAPLPWSAEDAAEDGVIIDAGGEVVLRIHLRLSTQAQLIAEMVVRGVNNHDDLIAANQRLRDALSALVPYATRHLPVCDCACCRARAALRETAP